MRRTRTTTARIAAALVAATPAVAVAVAGAGVALRAPVAPAETARSEPVLQTFELTAGTRLDSARSAAGTRLDSARLAMGTGLVAARSAAGTRLDSARSATAPRTAVLARRTTAPFSLLGVTWADPQSEPQGAIEVRTRRLGTEEWSSWQPLETDNPDASDGGSGVRGSSDPLWVGPSDGVQARMIATGDQALPAGLRVDLINPDAPETAPPMRMTPASQAMPEVGRGMTTVGRGMTTVGRGMTTVGRGMAPPVTGGDEAGRKAKRAGDDPETGEPDQSDGVPVVLPVRPVPKLVTRAGWGADESIVKEPPEYTGAVHIVFVHHTASGNGYDCAESPSIVRGIERFHVKSKGWNDLGYNFLVDKCGRIFEGRGGGVHRSVLGAHTLGFNANASAVAVIGDYRSTPIPAAARASVAQLAAYKLGAWSNPPLGKVGLVSGGSDRFPAGRTALLNRIAAHRDTGRTECPGNALYGQLTAIRAAAGAAPAGLRLRRVNGATAYGGKHYTRGAAGPAWDLSTPTRMMDRFEVLVDGRLSAAAPSGHRQAAVRVEPGEHRVTVRAVHLSGKVATTTAQVIVDPVAPDFSEPPQVGLREGTVGATVPVRLGWAATDTSGLKSVRVRGAASENLSGGTRQHADTARLGDPATWAVTATDRAGNPASASVTRTPVLLTEAEATRTGTWRTVRDQGFLGGEAVAGSTAGASLTWTFTGSSAALVANRTTASGRVRIYVDEEFQGIVDLRSASARNGQAVWARSWRGSGTHTVRAQAEGTTGRPSVVLDGLVYLR
ncbi:peptidoglycan recognition protein family protein [Actinoplanes sp. CA-252034]|uniref:peptidoglycan recognition protein family protein n=1 Tax=Actinoplanes sp. CA-252034 TaxID=3239906 RepID=UPI003D98A647